MEQVKRYIDVAASLKTDVVIGWVKGRFSTDNPPSLYYHLLTESMKELDAYSGGKCVRLVVEVINRYEVDCFITARRPWIILRVMGWNIHISIWIHSI